MGAVGGDGWGSGPRWRWSPRVHLYFLPSVALLRRPAAPRLRRGAEQQPPGGEERASVSGVWKGLLLPQSGRVFPFYRRLPFQMKVPVGLS